MGISYLIFTTDYSMYSSVNNISKRFNYLHPRVYVHHRKTPTPSVNADCEMRCHILRCSKSPTGIMHSSIPWPISTPLIANTILFSPDNHMSMSVPASLIRFLDIHILSSTSIHSDYSRSKGQGDPDRWGERICE
jgi:hypothetical protein